MNNLTSMKQRFISALDISDTPKEFLFNLFEEVYKQGYEDGISVIEQIKAEIKTTARKHLDIALSITDLTERKEHLKAEEALNYCISLIDRHIKEHET